MRALFVTMLCGTTLLAADPPVRAPISAEDAREICDAVARVTHETVQSIDEVLTENVVPGVTPQEYLNATAEGERHILKYPRRDYVMVRTKVRSSDVEGHFYEVQRFGDGWKIVKEGRFVN